MAEPVTNKQNSIATYEAVDALAKGMAEGISSPSVSATLEQTKAEMLSDKENPTVLAAKLKRLAEDTEALLKSPEQLGIKTEQQVGFNNEMVNFVQAINPIIQKLYKEGKISKDMPIKDMYKTAGQELAKILANKPDIVKEQIDEIDKTYRKYNLDKVFQRSVGINFLKDVADILHGLGPGLLRAGLEPIIEPFKSEEERKKDELAYGLTKVIKPITGNIIPERIIAAPSKAAANLVRMGQGIIGDIRFMLRQPGTYARLRPASTLLNIAAVAEPAVKAGKLGKLAYKTKKMGYLKYTPKEVPVAEQIKMLKTYIETNEPSFLKKKLNKGLPEADKRLAEAAATLVSSAPLSEKAKAVTKYMGAPFLELNPSKILSGTGSIVARVKKWFREKTTEKPIYSMKSAQELITPTKEDLIRTEKLIDMINAEIVTEKDPARIKDLQKLKQSIAGSIIINWAEPMDVLTAQTLLKGAEANKVGVLYETKPRGKKYVQFYFRTDPEIIRILQKATSDAKQIDGFAVTTHPEYVRLKMPKDTYEHLYEINRAVIEEFFPGKRDISDLTADEKLKFYNIRDLFIPYLQRELKLTKAKGAINKTIDYAMNIFKQNVLLNRPGFVINNLMGNYVFKSLADLRTGVLAPISLPYHIGKFLYRLLPEKITGKSLGREAAKLAGEGLTTAEARTGYLVPTAKSIIQQFRSGKIKTGLAELGKEVATRGTGAAISAGVAAALGVPVVGQILAGLAGTTLKDVILYANKVNEAMFRGDLLLKYLSDEGKKLVKEGKIRKQVVDQLIDMQKTLEQDKKRAKKYNMKSFGNIIAELDDAAQQRVTDALHELETYAAKEGISLLDLDKVGLSSILKRLNIVLNRREFNALHKMLPLSLKTLVRHNELLDALRKVDEFLYDYERAGQPARSNIVKILAPFANFLEHSIVLYSLYPIRYPLKSKILSDMYRQFKSNPDATLDELGLENIKDKLKAGLEYGTFYEYTAPEQVIPIARRTYRLGTKNIPYLTYLSTEYMSPTELPMGLLSSVKGSIEQPGFSLSRSILSGLARGGLGLTSPLITAFARTALGIDPLTKLPIRVGDRVTGEGYFLQTKTGQTVYIPVNWAAAAGLDSEKPAIDFRKATLYNIPPDRKIPEMVGQAIAPVYARALQLFSKYRTHYPILNPLELKKANSLLDTLIKAAKEDPGVNLALVTAMQQYNKKLPEAKKMYKKIQQAYQKNKNDAAVQNFLKQYATNYKLLHNLYMLEFNPSSIYSYRTLTKLPETRKIQALRSLGVPVYSTRDVLTTIKSIERKKNELNAAIKEAAKDMNASSFVFRLLQEIQ